MAGFDHPFFGDVHKSSHHVAVEQAIAQVRAQVKPVLSSGELRFATQASADAWRDAAMVEDWHEDERGRMVAPVLGDGNRPIALWLVVR